MAVASPVQYCAIMKKLIATVLLFTATSACKKDDKAADKANDKPGVAAKSAEAPSDELAAVLPKNAPAEFTAWDLPARAKAWQGAWISEASLGSPQALEIAGAVAKTWNGKEEKTLAFEIESPCSAKIIEKSASGSSSTTSHFTIKNGALVEGLGDAGSRKGNTAVACISNQVLTLDESGKCLSWDSMFDKWKSEPATCGFSTKDGKEVFTAKVNGSDRVLLVDGDALLSEQLSKRSAAKQTDWAAAKAAVKPR